GAGNLRSSTHRRDDRNLVSRVVNQLEWPALQVGDLLPVRTPGRRALPVRFRVGPFEGGQLPRLGAGSRVHHVNIVVVVPVPVFRSFADESDRLSVGSPRWQRFIVIARGELGSDLRGDIKEVQVSPLAAQITGVVLLEIVPVDDDRLWSSLVRGVGSSDFDRVTVYDRKHHPLA